MNMNRAADIIATDNDVAIARQLIRKAEFGQWERLTYGELTHCLAYVTIKIAQPVNFADSVRSERDRREIVAQMDRF